MNSNYMLHSFHVAQIAREHDKFNKLRDDFEYNLTLLRDRDAELEK